MQETIEMIRKLKSDAYRFYSPKKDPRPASAATSAGAWH